MKSEARPDLRDIERLKLLVGEVEAHGDDPCQITPAEGESLARVLALLDAEQERTERHKDLAAEVPEGYHFLTCFAYEKWPKLVIYRCRSCGSTGPAGSRCGPHDGGLTFGTITVPREPCVVCHYDQEPIDSDLREELEGDDGSR